MKIIKMISGAVFYILLFTIAALGLYLMHIGWQIIPAYIFFFMGMFINPITDWWDETWVKIENNQ